MAQTKIVRISRPFTKGWVTDRPRWALDQQEMADGQDVFWPRGVAVQRRPWDYVQATNPLGSSTPVASVMAVQLNPASTDITYIVTDTEGRVGVANTSTAQVAFQGTTNTVYLPRAYYDGEVILCPQDGISPILRWSGLNGSLTQITDIELVSSTPSGGYTGVASVGGGGGLVGASGSVQIARNKSTLVGTNTFFTTDAPRNSYINLRYKGNFGYHLRVDKVDTDTLLSLKTEPYVLSGASSPETLTGFTISSSPWGTIGLRTLVTDMGTATVSSTTLTGQGTDWQASGRGYGYAATGDIIARKPTLAVGTDPAINSTPDAGIINTITSATGGTLLRTPGVTYTAAEYGILRSMPGREVCAHQGRLWITGVEWEPNRVYVTPIAGATIDQRTGRRYDIGQPLNGDDNFETDYYNASQAKYVDVPDRFAEGRVVGLLSGRNVLLVLRSNSCYGIFGAWPGITVEQIADGAGCVDVRATTSAEEGLFWAGEEGIYQYVPGRGMSDITEGKVSREWRRVMRERSSSAIVSLGVVNRHLVVSYLDGSSYGLGSGSQPSFTWLFDIRTQTWCGKVSDVRARYMQTARLRGVPDDLFFAEGDSSTRRIGALASAFTDDDSTPASGTKEATFYAESGSIITGTATDSFRPTEMRVGYECEGSGTSVTVKTTSDDLSPTATQATLGETTDITSARVRASTDASTSAALGKSGRQFGFRLDTGATKPDKVAIHEIQVTAREFSTRE